MDLSLLTNKKLSDYFIESKDAIPPVAELQYAHEHPLQESFVQEINQTMMVAIGLLQILKLKNEERSFVQGLEENVVDMNGHMMNIKERNSALIVLKNLRSILHKADDIVKKYGGEDANLTKVLVKK